MQIKDLLHSGQVRKARSLITPVISQRTPFRYLDRIGAHLGATPLQQLSPFLEAVTQEGTIGGWPLIGSALAQHLDDDLETSLDLARRFIVLADVWHACDALGERVAGQALLHRFQSALEILSPWRADSNRWLRRAVGVSVHLWAKRAHASPNANEQASQLFAFLEPLFEERQMDAVKGVGWGLKTLGKHFPDLAADWLAQQVVVKQRPHRALMLRKALTYLSAEQRARATGQPVV